MERFRTWGEKVVAIEKTSAPKAGFYWTDFIDGINMTIPL
jgi:hypothetical protein